MFQKWLPCNSSWSHTTVRKRSLQILTAVKLALPNTEFFPMRTNWKTKFQCNFAKGRVWHSLKLTYPLKMDGLKTILSFWGPAYFQGLLLLVSGRLIQNLTLRFSKLCPSLAYFWILVQKLAKFDSEWWRQSPPWHFRQCGRKMLSPVFSSNGLNPFTVPSSENRPIGILTTRSRGPKTKRKYGNNEIGCDIMYK